MLIKQISAFIENKPGRLAEVTEYLSDANINIHALSIADTTDFGILRLIVSDSDAAKDVLKRNGLTVKATDVIAVALEHKPGSLSRVLRELEKEDLAVEYMYAFTSRIEEYDAMVILRLADQDNAIKRINKCKINMISSDIVKKL